VRPVERPARAGIAPAHIAQQFSEVAFYISAFSARFKPRFEQSLKRQRRFWKRAVGTHIDGALQALQGFHPRGGNGRAMGRHFVLQPAEPGIVEHALGKQTLALTHGAFVGRSGVAVLRGARQGEPIKKPPAITRGAAPQPVHCRGQPSHPRGLAEFSGGGGLAVAAGEPLDPALRCALSARAQHRDFTVKLNPH
jgi:hypothetical protein